MFSFSFRIYIRTLKCCCNCIASKCPRTYVNRINTFQKKVKEGYVFLFAVEIVTVYYISNVDIRKTFTYYLRFSSHVAFINIE